MEWIYLHPFVVKGKRDYSFQYLTVLVSGILLVLLINTEKEMEVAHKSIVDGLEWYILRIILLTDELTEITLRSLIAQHGVEYNVTNLKTLPIFYVILLEYLT